MSQNDNDQTTQNRIDIEIIKNDISTIKNNHLSHIEASMANMEKRIEKIDGRIWVIVLGVLSIVASVYAERLF